jgi:hypothetical protein
MEAPGSTASSSPRASKVPPNHALERTLHTAAAPLSFAVRLFRSVPREFDIMEKSVKAILLTAVTQIRNVRTPIGGGELEPRGAPSASVEKDET